MEGQGAERDAVLEIAALVSARDVTPAEALIRQDAAEDGKIYFILAGTFRVLINGRDVAIRREREVVGEMAAAKCHRNTQLPGGSTRGEFEKASREVKVRVDGQLVVNGVDEVIDAARVGIGLGFVPEDLVRRYIVEGELRRALDDWCAPFPGFHLYYPSRRHASPAFSLLVDARRHRRSS